MTIPWPRTALERPGANVGLDGLEFSRSDEAQQLSACAWVSTRSVAELPDSPLCIEHAPPSEQHAIRASGVGIQPAHTAPLAVAITIARMAADRRLRNLSTGSRMLDEPDDVNWLACSVRETPEPRRPKPQRM